MSDDDAKSRILARRAKFVAAAVASLGTATACDRCGDHPMAQPCLAVPLLVHEAGATIEDDAAPPRPCLEVPRAPLDGGRPRPCLSIARPPTARDAGATTQHDAAAPRPCLEPIVPDRIP